MANKDKRENKDMCFSDLIGIRHVLKMEYKNCRVCFKITVPANLTWQRSQHNDAHDIEYIEYHL